MTCADVKAAACLVLRFFFASTSRDDCSSPVAVRFFLPNPATHGTMPSPRPPSKQVPTVLLAFHFDWRLLRKARAPPRFSHGLRTGDFRAFVSAHAVCSSAAYIWKTHVQRAYLWLMFFFTLGISVVLVWSETFFFISKPLISIWYVWPLKLLCFDPLSLYESKRPVPEHLCGHALHVQRTRHVLHGAELQLRPDRGISPASSSKTCAWTHAARITSESVGSGHRLSSLNHVQFFCLVVMAYMAVCVYDTLFRIRVFNYFYLTPNQHSDATSLLFSALYVFGSFLCRVVRTNFLVFSSWLHDPSVKV